MTPNVRRTALDAGLPPARGGYVNAGVDETGSSASTHVGELEAHGEDQ